MSIKQDFQKIYPLSPMQQRMLYHYLQDKNSQISFEQDEMYLTGSLDVILFEKSFNKIIQRYDILRTNFVYQKIKEPRQVVFKEKREKIYYEDISNFDDTKKIEYVKNYKSQDRERGFDLMRDTLIRLAIFKIDDKNYRLIWSYHHIIMDGWCLGLIFQDFVQIYQSLKNGTPLNLGKVYPYSNYITWLQKQDRNEVREYWRNYIADYKQSTFPYGYHNSINNRDYLKTNKTIRIDGELYRGMERLAGDYNVTINTVFQAIWGILLQRYNNTNDVVFGAVVSGRPPEVEGVEQMLGLFINSVPVRVKSDHQKTFIQIVKQLQADGILSAKYEYFPLAEIEGLSTNSRGLINNLVIFENYPLDKEVINQTSQDLGFVLNSTESTSQTRYDLNIYLVAGDRLDIRFAYNAKAFPTDIVDRLATHIKILLKAVIANPEIKVDELDFLTDEEKQQIQADNEYRVQMKDLRNSSNLEYLAPTNPVEQKLVHLWEEVLDVEGVGISHNFFEIGGDSVNITSLMKMINEEFGVDLSVSELFLNPTIASFAANLHKDSIFNQMECMVSLNKISESKPNLFVIHGMEGSAYLYKDLAKLLKEDCNFYGIQAKGYLDPSKMVQSLDEMITDYIREIKMIQPEGPYLIGGYCWGARLMYELIRRMEAQGDVINKMIAIDEYAFIPRNRVRILRIQDKIIRPFAFVKKLINQQFGTSRQFWSDEYSGTSIVNTKDTNLVTERTIEENIVYLGKTQFPYRGIVKAPVYVIKANEHNDPRFKVELWQEMTYGNVTFIHVPGQHLTLFEHPYVEGLANAVRKVLQDSDSNL